MIEKFIFMFALAVDSGRRDLRDTTGTLKKALRYFIEM